MAGRVASARKTPAGVAFVKPGVPSAF
jgi:hypothetical protein